MKRLISIISAAVLLTGCMSLKTEMVNANGTFKDCAATGGGLGLGAVVGVAIAAAARSGCVNDQKEGGFLEAEHAGTLHVKFAASTDEAPLTVSESRINGIQTGDQIVAINGKAVATSEEFQSAVFGPIDQSVEVKIIRTGTTLIQTASRTPFEKKKESTE